MVNPAIGGDRARVVRHGTETAWLEMRDQRLDRHVLRQAPRSADPTFGEHQIDPIIPNSGLGAVQDIEFMTFHIDLEHLEPWQSESAQLIVDRSHRHFDRRVVTFRCAPVIRDDPSARVVGTLIHRGRAGSPAEPDLVQRRPRTSGLQTPKGRREGLVAMQVDARKPSTHGACRLPEIRTHVEHRAPAVERTSHPVEERPDVEPRIHAPVQSASPKQERHREANPRRKRHEIRSNPHAKRLRPGSSS